MPRVQESVGDIFSAPPNSVLLHACNCRGVWGSGVALEFKKRFPRAFTIYTEYCNTPPSPSHQRSLLGTALLIPPPSAEEEEEDEETDNNGDGSDTSTDHCWIACVFTSLGYGRTVSSAEVILDSTKKGMGDLHKKLSFLKAGGKDIGDVWAVRINSGKFGVPWDRTKRILEQCAVNVKVVRPPGEGGDGDEEESKTTNVEAGQIPEKGAEQGDPPTDGSKLKERKRKSVDEDGEEMGNQDTKDVAVDKKPKKKKKKTIDEKRLKQS